MINYGYEVIIASSGKQLTLLKEEFEEIQFIELPGYNISYGKNGWLTFLGFLFQIPSILNTIKKENLWLNQFIIHNKVDLVISDNRYGLYTSQVPCVFITHQLKIKTSLGSIADWFLQKLNYRYLNRFTECWIPDYDGPENYAGDLSHPVTFPVVPVKYLGPLSRFKEGAVNEGASNLLIILSGPEPQRTIFEKRLVAQLKDYPNSVVLLRGLPGGSEIPETINTRLKIYNHVSSAIFYELIHSSSYIICRPGYSSIMDLLPLKKKCIFVATPGQPEQHYLALYLRKRNLGLSFSQDGFSLIGAVEQAERFRFEFMSCNNSESYKKIIKIVTELIDSY